VPISVALPSRLSDLATGEGIGILAGGAIGAIGSNYVGNLIQSYTGYTGYMGLAVKALGKLLFTGLMFYLRNLAPSLGTLGLFAGVTSASSILVDIFNYLYPGGGAAAGQVTGLVVKSAPRPASRSVPTSSISAH